MRASSGYQHAPGFRIRRLHQFSVAIFMEEMAAFDITPVQFAILNALLDIPGSDQISLAQRVAFDAATSGSVIARLESRGLIRREGDTSDKRRKRLWVTPEGEQLAQQMKELMPTIQSRILGPLSEQEGLQLTGLLNKLLAGHEAGR